MLCIKIMKKQIPETYKKKLKKQQYRVVGAHSAVKVCGWTKNCLRGKGKCYKHKFYGIQSHQCMQMTTSMFCASRCKFCWRGQKAPVSEKWYGVVDSPKKIINDSLKQHAKLLIGFGGLKGADKKLINEMKNVKHVALSLTGEPITYPRINELLQEFHKQEISTFIVTNAQYPNEIKKIKNVTQLYLSIDAPNKELMKKIDRPLFKDYWERMLESLKILKTRKYRTAIRLSLIKNENMVEPENYAELIKIGMPWFIELKSYMWVGASQDFYSVENMPLMDDVRNFGKELLKFLEHYEIADEHVPSRTMLLVRKNKKGQEEIDFSELSLRRKEDADAGKQ